MVKFRKVKFKKKTKTLMLKIKNGHQKENFSLYIDI